MDIQVKKVKGTLGEMELKIPRDRNGSYDPKIVPKYSKDISELEGKIIGMYGIGMRQEIYPIK